MIYKEQITDKSIIGVFLSGVNLSVGKVKDNKVVDIIKKTINNNESEEFILKELINTISEIYDDNVVGIGVGVPSLVDVKKGIVYKVQNIPAWREVHLKDILENKFNTNVYINNDANCFAVGEKYFGKANKYSNIVGIIIGTGMGAGIIFNGHLYSGQHCGAGEFGSIPYKDHDYEYYLSEGYFEEKYGIKAETLLSRAKNNDKIALAVFEQYGIDLGNVIKTILYSVDPEIIIIGGRLSKAYKYFKKSMWRKVKTYRYKHSLKNLKIEVTSNNNIAVLGAAALYPDAKNLILHK